MIRRKLKVTCPKLVDDCGKSIEGEHPLPGIGRPQQGEEFRDGVTGPLRFLAVVVQSRLDVQLNIMSGIYIYILQSITPPGDGGKQYEENEAGRKTPDPDSTLLENCRPFLYRLLFLG